MKFCPTCNKKLIPKQQMHCPECEEKHKQKKAIYDKKYDSVVRYNNSFRWVYRDKRWKKLVEYVKEKQNGLCRICIANKAIGFVDAVHHIETLDDDINQAFDQENLIGLCRYHHDYVHAEYNRGNKQKKEMQKVLKDI